MMTRIVVDLPALLGPEELVTLAADLELSWSGRPWSA